MNILIWWVLPSLLCLLLLLQGRHIAPKKTLQEYLKIGSGSDRIFTYLNIIIWPIFIIVVVSIGAVVLVLYIKNKIQPISFNWLIKER